MGLKTTSIKNTDANLLREHKKTYRGSLSEIALIVKIMLVQRIGISDRGTILGITDNKIASDNSDQVQHTLYRIPTK